VSQYLLLLVQLVLQLLAHPLSLVQLVLQIRLHNLVTLHLATGLLVIEQLSVMLFNLHESGGSITELFLLFNHRLQAELLQHLVQVFHTDHNTWSTSECVDQRASIFDFGE
jgi:hypothetical protein